MKCLLYFAELADCLTSRQSYSMDYEQEEGLTPGGRPQYIWFRLHGLVDRHPATMEGS